MERCINYSANTTKNLEHLEFSENVISSIWVFWSVLLDVNKATLNKVFLFAVISE